MERSRSNMSVFLNVFMFILSSACVCGFQVNTTEGVIEGLKAGDGDYHVFYGIPYAGPTEGNNRFKGPVPPTVRSELFHANDSNIICAQPSDRGLIGVENCLTVSIFTKNITTPKPVIVWLNSEEYTTTNTQPFSYRRFVEEDIVFVTLNFRLSIFGFLCLGIEEAPGNAGLRDAIQGLKWINSNIANFGGNPNNVILMGHASGAAMVDLLTMSPLVKGLVHKAIALSGSSLSPWAVAYDPVGYANLLGSKLGYTGKTRKELANRLIKTDLTVLNTALNEFSFKNNTPLFAPCIENVHLNPNDTVLTDAPLHLLKGGNYIQIPFIAGYTTREGTMRANEAVYQNWLGGMQVNFSDFLQVNLNFGGNRTSVASTIREFYFDNSAISMETIEDYLDYQGDTLVAVSVIQGARERGQISFGEVRLLEFGYIGTMNSDWIYPQIPLSGVRHGGLLNYFFDYDLKPNDEVVRNSLLKRFATFAYTGKPNVANVTATATWSAITKDKLNYFYYGGSDIYTNNQSVIHAEENRYNPHNLTMKFWNDILLKYYEPPKAMSASGKIISSVIFIILSQLLMCLF